MEADEQGSLKNTDLENYRMSHLNLRGFLVQPFHFSDEDVKTQEDEILSPEAHSKLRPQGPDCEFLQCVLFSMESVKKTPTIN